MVYSKSHKKCSPEMELVYQSHILGAYPLKKALTYTFMLRFLSILYTIHYIYTIYMKVSVNGDTPSSRPNVILGFSIINQPLGDPPFMETPLYILHLLYYMMIYIISIISLIISYQYLLFITINVVLYLVYVYIYILYLYYLYIISI